MLFERTLLFRWAWAVTEQMIEQNIERSVTRHSDGGWRRKTWTLLGGAARHIFSASEKSVHPNKWTKRFFEAHNLPRWFFVFEKTCGRIKYKVLAWTVSFLTLWMKFSILVWRPHHLNLTVTSLYAHIRGASGLAKSSFCSGRNHTWASYGT